MSTCPQCIGERRDTNSPLVSTVRYKRKEGYKYCIKCGRRWPILKSETSPLGYNAEVIKNQKNRSKNASDY